ncbi:MAG: NTP transferase domain-containing protein [Treponema sp.]|nr:NTP transferase domain-containing protein [Candidatus Treponema caballi]
MNKKIKKFMNKRECDILKYLDENSFVNQRTVAEKTGCAVGMVNQTLKLLEDCDLINADKTLTEKGRETVRRTSPKRAIILAAGFGMRMVPINMSVPKALLEVRGETIIERIIKQLHEAGITEIYVVAGFMMERFEYLIDEYGVEIIVNSEYALKNNLHSLYLARDYLENAYVIPCNVWTDFNPYSKNEMYSWYMIDDKLGTHGYFWVNRKQEVMKLPDIVPGFHKIGISYIGPDEAPLVRERLEKYDSYPSYDTRSWDEILFEQKSVTVYARKISNDDFAVINTYEQLRELDSGSNHLKTEAITIAAETLDASPSEITDIEILKKGMTNRSFLFSCRDKRYIMRIPGEGTDQLVNRREEAAVYRVLKGKGICDNIIYINPDNGYKITEYIENSHASNPMNVLDVHDCMKRLREFHNLRLKVDHTFEIFGKINFYESLWDGKPSVYRDYSQTKENVFSLKPYIDEHAKAYALTHVDAVPDNFLFSNENLKKQIHIIDWEYAGMQDQDVDLAMFCIYAMYDRKHVDKLIDAYYTEGCLEETRVKIYCYIACCGLLWSNWCEYKRNLGVDFGEYALRQYRYAKEYYRIVMNYLEEGEIK